MTPHQVLPLKVDVTGSICICIHCRCIISYSFLTLNICQGKIYSWISSILLNIRAISLGYHETTGLCNMFPGELLFYKVKYSNTRQQSDYDYDVSEYCFSIGKLVSKISNRTSYNYAPLTANVSTAIFVLSNLGNYFSNCCIK